MSSRQLFRIVILSLTVTFIADRPASAQYPTRFSSFGYGYGPGFGPRVGPWFGPGLWGYPFFFSGAYGGFWLNGNSLYGPPVPTYGPVPGSFGGGDAQRLYYGNGGFFSLYQSSGAGVRGASRDFAPAVPPADWKGPRFATRDVKRRYAQDRADPQSAIDRAYRDAAPYGPRR